jgi:DNA-binding IclR family transcriptional regulator
MNAGDRQRFVALWRAVAGLRDLNSSARAVLFELALTADQDGRTAATSSALARRLGFADLTVRRAISSLRAAGYLVADYRDGGRGRPLVYRLGPPIDSAVWILDASAAEGDAG